MKKILIVINNFNIGGIQKALTNLLNEIHNDYIITLFVINLEGDFINDIPENIKVICADKPLKSSEVSLANINNFSMYLSRMIFSAWTKVFGKAIPAYLATKIFQKNIGDFDVAISFSQPIHDKQFCVLCNEAVLYSCNAKKKVTFVHCDFERYGGNTKHTRKLYSKFDAIAAVSDSVGEIFKKVNPNLADRVYTVRNCHDYKTIQNLAKIDPVTYDTEYSIVSAVRLEEEKGLLRCIPLIKKICDLGIDLSWHIIGGGSLETKIKQSIAENQMESRIILHGWQPNPYRYMVNADYFLLPSYHEAAPIVYDEAMCLNLPVLTTNTTSAIELVKNRNIGFVCENKDEEIMKMIIENIYNKKEYKKSHIVDNRLALSQFDEICK